MKNKINPKSFPFVKFLLTIGLFFQYSISLIVLTNILKSTTEKAWIKDGVYYPLQFCLLFGSLIAFVAFNVIKFYLHKKVNYKYLKKEFIQILFIYLILIAISIMSIVVIFTFKFNNIDQKIFAICFLIIQIISGIIAAILETFSRMREQAIVNQQWIAVDGENPSNETISHLKKEKTINPFLEGDKIDD